MQLSYVEKQKIFHDKFLEFVWEFKQLQGKIEAKQDVPQNKSNLKALASITSIIPVVGNFIRIIDVFNDYLNGDFSNFLQVSVHHLFPYDQFILKEILSEAVLKVIFHFESKLIDSQEINEIEAYAVLAGMKFLNSLRKVKDNSLAINEQDIEDSILKQENIIHDIFTRRTAFDSENYQVIYETTLSDFKNSNSVDLNNFLKIKYNFQNSNIKQFYLVGDISPDLQDELDLSFKGLNGYDFDTNDVTIINYRLQERYKNIDFKFDRLMQIVLYQMELLREMQKVMVESKGYVNNFHTIEGTHLGREKEVEFLHNGFGMRACQVISGVKGIGKTFIAKKYSEKYEYEYEKVIWFSASSQVSLAVDFRKFLQANKVDIQGSDDKQIYKLVKEILTNKLSKSLIVFDGVENSEFTQEIIGNLVNNSIHHFIITTENEIKQVNMHENPTLQINPLTADESIEYIKSRMPFSDSEDIDELAKITNGNPMVLELAVSYIRSKGITIGDYLRGINNIINNEAEEQLLINQITIIIKDLSNLGSEMVKMCSYLHSSAIPVSLFSEWFKDNPELNPIPKLSSSSLIKTSISGDDNNQIFITFHKVVQSFIRERYGRAEILQKTIQLINKQMSDFIMVGHDIDDILNKNLSLGLHANSLLNHVRNLEFIDNLDFVVDIVRLEINYANLLFAQGEVENAKHLYEVTLTRLKQIVIDQKYTGRYTERSHILLGQLYQFIGNCHEKLANYDQSIKYFNSALEIRISLLTIDGDYKLQVARTHYAIACVNCKQNKLEWANGNFSKSLTFLLGKNLTDRLIQLDQDAINEILLLDNPLKITLIAKILDGIGTSRKLSKQFEKAMKFYELALKTNMKIHTEGSNQMNFLIKQHIGEAYLDIKKFKLARNQFEEVLQYYRKKHGDIPHIDTAMSAHRLGDYYLYNLQFKKAIIYYEESLQIKKRYGNQYEDYMASTLGSMGQAYYRLSMNHESLKNYEASLAIKRRIHNNNAEHPEVLLLENHFNIIELSQFFPVPYILKEILESRHSFKYFFKEIMQIDKQFPFLQEMENIKLFDRYIFLIPAHFSASLLGLYLTSPGCITLKKLMAISLPTTAFALNLFFYDSFSPKEQLNNKSKLAIKNFSDFYYECKGEVFYHISIGIVNSIIFTNVIPGVAGSIKFESAAMPVFAGLSCYASHQPITNQICAEEKLWFIPKIADVLVASLAISFMNFNHIPEGFKNNKVIMSVVVTKQIFTLLNTIVLTDYTAKLLTSTFVEEINYFVDNSLHFIDSIMGGIQVLIGERPVDIIAE